MALKLGLRRRLETIAADRPAVRSLLTRVRIIRAGWSPPKWRHPIDRLYRIETQAPLPLYLLRDGSAAAAHMIPYGGCVPSALREAIGWIDGIGRATFLDLGCGKGRAMAIATEFAFRAIVGIELSPDLAAAARRNLRLIARRHPDRTPAHVSVGDASAPTLPAGDLLVFLYHPFDAPLVERLARHLVASAAGRMIYVVYENPVHGNVFDDHPAFSRRRAAMLPCSADELPFAFDPEEAIAVWQTGPREAGPSTGSWRIVVTKPGYRAILASASDQVRAASA